MVIAMEVLEKIGLWALGIIPLIVGFVYILQEAGVVNIVNVGMWPVLVFLFGLLYTIGYFTK